MLVLFCGLALATEFAEPALWAPAQQALGWTAVSVSTPRGERLAVAELPTRGNGVAGWVTTAPGVSSWRGDVRFDGLSVVQAGGFTMVAPR